jgi:5-methylcytosine-specific restriction endonuclease McrA
MCRLCKNETGRIRRFRTEDGKRWSDNNNAAMRLKPERAIKFKAQQRKKYAEDTEFRQRERDRNKEYRKANPEQHVMHVNAYRSRRKNADGVLELDEWDDVCERYNYKCIDCGSDGPLTVGHAIPLSLGGSNWEDNIIPQCKSCNSKQHANIHPSVNLKTGEVDRSYYVAA